MAEAAEYAGRTIHIRYESGLEVEARYDSPTRMSWRALRGPAEGQSGTETIHAAEIAPSVFFISWVEREKGFTVSNVVDFPRRRITAFVTWDEGNGREASLDTGTFEEIG